MTQAEIKTLFLDTLRRIEDKVDNVTSDITDIKVKQGEDSVKIENLECTLNKVVATEKENNANQAKVLEETYKDLTEKFHAVDKSLATTKKQASAGGAVGGSVGGLVIGLIADWIFKKP